MIDYSFNDIYERKFFCGGLLNVWFWYFDLVSQFYSAFAKDVFPCLFMEFTITQINIYETLPVVYFVGKDLKPFQQFNSTVPYPNFTYLKKQ